MLGVALMNQEKHHNWFVHSHAIDRGLLPNIEMLSLLDGMDFIALCT